MFLTVMAIVALGALYLLLRTPSTTKVNMIQVDKEEQINMFYYRSVPGLKRAEELGLVMPVHRRYEIPGCEAELKIDRIWYNQKDVYIFYHVENLPQLAYLGGQLYLEGNVPEETAVFWGADSIGRASEKGVVYKGNFYSCLRLPALRDRNQQLLKEIHEIFYSPYLVIDQSGKKDKEETGFEFDPIKIELNYSIDKEYLEKIEMEHSVDVGDGQLKFYQLNIGSSYNRLYFLYINDRRDIIYHLKGTILSNSGEYHRFDGAPDVITEYPYHYYIDFSPFDKTPDSIEITIESMDLIGNKQFVFDIIPEDYDKKSQTYHVKKEIAYMDNAEILLDSVKTEEDIVWLYISYIEREGLTSPYSILRAELPNAEKGADVLGSMHQLRHPVGNIITVQNLGKKDSQKVPEILGLVRKGDNLFGFGLSREFWDTSEKILVQISNLTYRINANKKTNLKLMNE